MTTKIDGLLGVDRVKSASIDLEDLKWVPPFTKDYVSPEQVYTNGGVIDLTHNLGAPYKLCVVTLVCVITQLGYAVGTELELGSRQDHSTAAYGFNIRKLGSTGIRVVIGASGLYEHGTDGTGSAVVLTAANWRLVVRAWA